MILEEDIPYMERVFGIIIALVSLITLLYAMAILVEKYLLSCFLTISEKYKLNDEVTGYMLAIASSIPEFTTNSIASLKQNTSMLQFGMGAITGSGAYDFTVCLGVASYFVIKSQFPNGLQINKHMFYRDSIVYLLTLAILAFFLRDNIIDIFEALILCSLWPIYLYFANLFNVSSENNKEIEDDESNKLIEEGKSFKYPEITSEKKIESDSILTVNVNSYKKMKNSDKSTFNTETTKQIVDDVRNSQNNKKGDIENPLKIINSSSHKENKVKKLLKFFMEIPKQLIDFITFCIISFYDCLIPLKKSITLSLIILAIMSFIQTRTTIYLIEKLSFYTNLSASFLGMTLISWGNNVGDTINASVAAKLGKVDLLVSSILGTQILNLQFCLGFPWFISTLTTSGLQILIADTNTFRFFATVFFVVLATILAFTMFSMRLHRISGMVLILIYLVYITYEFKNNISIY